MEPITYNNIVNNLVERFPDYRMSDEFDKDSLHSQYVMFSGFGRFLTAEIEKEEQSDELTKRAFQFINEIYNGPTIKSDTDPQDTLQNLIYIEIFENLAQTKRGVQIARKYLIGKAKDEFETVFRYTGVEKYKPSKKTNL